MSKFLRILLEPCDRSQNCDMFQLLPLVFRQVALQSALLIQLSLLLP